MGHQNVIGVAAGLVHAEKPRLEAELLLAFAADHAVAAADPGMHHAPVADFQPFGSWTERQDLAHLATLTSFDELCGLGYAHIDAENGFFQALTLDQVRAVAMKYLKPDARVVAVVKPEET